MSIVLNKNTKEIFYSVNTPDYPETDYIINPDLSNVTDLKPSYWKIEGKNVLPMTVAEKMAVDIELTAEKELKTPACPYGLRETCEYYNV